MRPREGTYPGWVLAAEEKNHVGAMKGHYAAASVAEALHLVVTTLVVEEKKYTNTMTRARAEVTDERSPRTHGRFINPPAPAQTSRRGRALMANVYWSIGNLLRAKNQKKTSRTATFS